MVTLKEDIKKQSEWTAITFKSDGYELYYTIHSFIEIDTFFQNQLKINLCNSFSKKLF